MRNQFEQLVSYLAAHDFVDRDPGGYLSQMLDDARIELSKTGSSYAAGFKDGLNEAAHTLRVAADNHDFDAEVSKKVLESQAHKLASALFRSWANGIEMNANRVF